MKKVVGILLMVLTALQGIHAQQIHSHNDYEQNVPFWKAYAAGASSIEVDVHLLNDTLYVAHDHKEIQRSRTIESLYLSPIRQLFIEKSIASRPFLLLIDIKTEAYTSLEKTIELLHPLQDILYPKNPEGVKIVISGGRPQSADYSNYPDFVFFDWQSTDKPENSEKVALVSLSFNTISRWNGSKPATVEEKKQLNAAISRMKLLNKPIRFWASPDTPIAWQTLLDMGVDFIGTDKPVEAMSYFSGNQNKR